MPLKNNLLSFLNLFEGKSVDDIVLEKKILHKKTAKNHLHNLVIKLIKIEFDLGRSEDYHLKVLRINENNNITQSMSFPYFKFINLVKEKWEESDIRKCFNKPFLFIIFKGKDQSNPKFLKTIFWKMPSETIEDDIQNIWRFTKDLILSGNIVNYVDYKGRLITNFPSISNTKTVHVRPHGRNSLDVDLLPKPDKNTGLNKIPKHCFWLNKHYIKRVIINAIK